MSADEEIPTTNSLQEDAGLELGDTIQILGGRLDKTKGVLYYFDEDQFKVLPMGASDRLITIPLVDGSPEEDLGIEELLILQKVVVPGFLTLADIRVGQGVDTFQKNGIPGPRFTVTSVNVEEDSAVFTTESGDIQELPFDFSGIPRDMPFEVIRTKDLPVAASNELQEEVEFYEEGAAASGADAEVAPPLPTVQLLESIELDELEVLEETPSSERIYPDVIQMTDMLSQLLLQLTPEQQKNPLRLKELGRLVELMLRMRNEVVRYGVTGEPRGGLPTSLQTLADMIQQPNIPLSRKIIEMTKEVYLDHTQEHYINLAAGKETPDPIGHVEEHLEWRYLEDVVKQAIAMETSMQESGSTAVPGTSIGLPPFFVELERMRSAIQSPYHMTNTETDNQTIAVDQDEEVFRLEAPSDSTTIPALSARGIKRKDFLTPPAPVEEISHSIVRLLGSRKVRFQTKGGEALRTVEEAEHYTPETSLLFPLKTLRALGPIRSRMLAQDMSLASSTPLLLQPLLADLGESTEFPTAEGILRIGLHGGMVGNIRVKDWLESLPLRIFGTADAAHILQPYGLDRVEFSVEQSEVLHQKILESLAALRKFLIEKRQEAKQFLETLRFTPSGLLESSRAQRLLERIQSEPLLRDAYDKAKEEMGELADLDLVWIPYLNRLYPDLLLAVLGQQPLRTAKERAAVVRDQFAHSFQHGYALRQKLETAGVAPEVNSCPHVGDLETIRKVRDDADRMRLLTKFLGDYRGLRENNWIECNVCSQHLLCAHELFQIQQYLRPAEKEVLEKELNLTFSGGVFHGKFICKNCGQPMRDLDFDMHIEFDDEGRPMMGRSVMVDEDAIRKEALEDMLSGPSTEAEDTRDWGSEDANLIYRLLFALTNKIGISPDQRDYERMIEQISGYVATLYTRSVYAQITKAQGKAALDYDVYRIRFLIAGTAAHLLLNIQTHVPEYIIRYTHEECKAGFFGFPLESEANTSGIECMSGVLAGFMKDDAPWNQTGFQKEGNPVKRKALFRRYVESLVKDFAKHPLTQNALREKRGYLTKLYGGTGGDLQDQIPTSFRPVPLLLSAEEAAELSVAPASAKEEDAVGTAWIRQAHAIARANTVLNPDIPYAETTCCFHDLRNPQEFWDSNSPFTLAAKRISTKAKSSIFGLSSKVVKQPVLKGDVDPRMLYQLFSHVCFQGPQKGKPHELGLTLRCRWCGVQFPEDPALPPAAQPFSSDRATQKQLNEEYFGELLKKEDGIKASLQAQGAVIDEENFQDVLDTSRKEYTIDPLLRKSIQRAPETIAEFAEVEPAPFPGWGDLLRTAFVNLEKLEGASPTPLQIAQAAEELLERLGSYEEDIERRLGEAPMKLLKELYSVPSSEFKELLTTHMIIPFRRWVSGFLPSNNILRLYELSQDTVADIHRGLESHMRSFMKIAALEPNTLPHAKVVYFVEQVSVICSNILPKLRAILLPGGRAMMELIHRACLMGPLWSLLNPQEVPIGSAMEEGAVDGLATNLRAIYRAISQTFQRIQEERLNYTDEQLKVLIEARNEKEKNLFIKKQDTMTREQQQVFKLNKSLGIGEWSVGGTKVIYAYDPERYEVERQERAMAGIVDYAQGAAAGWDMMGFDYGAEYEADGGYDNAQTAEDDY